MDSEMDEKVAEYKEKLQNLVQQKMLCGEMEYGNDKESWVCRTYQMKEGLGKAIYKSYSDGELLMILRWQAENLGYAPAQREVFWVYRNYIRLRFGKWPYALKAAGLSTRAGRGGMSMKRIKERDQRYEELLTLVRQKTKELGRPPHMFELDEERKELRVWFTTWAEVLDAAGVNRDWKQKEILYKVKNFNEEETQLLGEIKELAQRLGRPPLRTEVSPEVRKKLNRRCGTWCNTLYQLGMEPVMKVSPFSNTYLSKGREKQKKHQDILCNSLYKLVAPDERTKKMLLWVKEKAEVLGRSPMKSELPSEIYSVLTKKCSTYRNVLYQIGLTPLDKQSETQEKVKLRSGRNTNKPVDFR